MFFSVSLLETELRSCAQCVYTWRVFKTLSCLTLLLLLSGAASLNLLLNIFAKIDMTLAVTYCQNKGNGC